MRGQSFSMEEKGDGVLLNESNIAVGRRKVTDFWSERWREGLTNGSRLNKLKEEPWREDCKSFSLF